MDAGNYGNGMIKQNLDNLFFCPVDTTKVYPRCILK